MARTPTIPGPDPHPKTPSFKAPPNSCDTHTHIFGPDAQYPYADDGSYIPPDAGLDDFRKLHEAIGIERAVIVQTGIFNGNDVTYETDFRAVYARVLDSWLGTSSTAILGGDFRASAPAFL